MERDPRNGKSCKNPSDVRPRIENSCSKRALLGGKPFRNRLDAGGKKPRVAENKGDPPHEETRERVCRRGGDGKEAPKKHDEGIERKRADPVSETRGGAETRRK